MKTIHTDTQNGLIYYDTSKRIAVKLAVFFRSYPRKATSTRHPEQGGLAKWARITTRMYHLPRSYTFPYSRNPTTYTPIITLST